MPGRDIGAGDTLVVSEVFGPTWQGEGPSLGRLTAFVRLGRCNLACTWCDTAYTWDWSRFDPATELEERTVDDVVAQLDEISAPMVVVSGGEPMLQQRAVIRLLEQIKERSWRTEVETAGTLAPTPELTAVVDQFNVSPKLANSGNERDRRYRPDVLRALQATGRAIFKFVVSEALDLDEIDEIVAACELAPVYVMPEGTAADVVGERLRAIADPVLARGWNITTRLHIEIWGDRRGV